MLGLFINALTDPNKYSLLNRDNLKQHFTEKLSQKRNLLSNFFFTFSKFRFHFENFRRKYDPHS